MVVASGLLDNSSHIIVDFFGMHNSDCLLLVMESLLCLFKTQPLIVDFLDYYLQVQEDVRYLYKEKRLHPKACHEYTQYQLDFYTYLRKRKVVNFSDGEFSVNHPSVNCIFDFLNEVTPNFHNP